MAGGGRRNRYHSIWNLSVGKVAHMLRKILGTVTALVICLTFAACGGDEGASGGSTTTPVNTETGETPPTGGEPMDIGPQPGGTGTDTGGGTDGGF